MFIMRVWLDCLKFKEHNFERREYHRFFTELDVLPGRDWAIIAHLFPIIWCSMRIILSYHSWKADLSKSGWRLVIHLSRHCFEVPVFTKLAFFPIFISINPHCNDQFLSFFLRPNTKIDFLLQLSQQQRR
jgi:hypothetical protein